MTVQELLSRISSEELAEWMAFSTIQMLPGMADDWRAAMLASTIANVNRASDSDPMPLSEFLPRMVQDEEVEESPDRSLALLARLEALAQNQVRTEEGL